MTRQVALAGVLTTLFVCGGCDRPATSTPTPWQVQELPTSADFYEVQFHGRDGWIVGGGHLVNGGLVGRTTDRGETWQFDSGLVKPLPGMVGGLHLTAIHFVDRFKGFVGTSRGQILITYDGGESWRLVKKGSMRGGESISDLHFVDDLHGYAVGMFGFYATEDGGDTWWVRRRGRDGEVRLDGRAVFFADPDHGWLAGKFGRLLSTTDGGRSWKPPASDVDLPGTPPPDLVALHFVDRQTGWAVGEKGTIVHTTDGGATWTQQTSGVPDYLHDVRFLDAQRGWVVGHRRAQRRSVVLSTTDGGANWTIEFELPDEELRALHADDDGAVWAVGGHVGHGRQILAHRTPLPNA